MMMLMKTMKMIRKRGRIIIKIRNASKIGRKTKIKIRILIKKLKNKKMKILAGHKFSYQMIKIKKIYKMKKTSQYPKKLTQINKK